MIDGRLEVAKGCKKRKSGVLWGIGLVHGLSTRPIAKLEMWTCRGPRSGRADAAFQGV